ncbi:MAG: ABC transporter permease [Planctomycetota bacterium]
MASLRLLPFARRELRSAFESPVAYVAIALFVVVAPALFFFLGYPVGDVPLPGLWEGGQASLIVLFHWLPLLLAIVVPALTMGSWSEERRSGTEELLLTYPVRTAAVVLGKFLGAFTLTALMVTLAVLSAALTVDRMGDLDWNTVWVGLFGSGLLIASYVSVGLFLSSLSAEQLVAFLTGALLLGLLWALPLFVRIFPGGVASVLESASPQSHFLGGAARGVIDLRDVVYFLLLTLLGLFANGLVIESRRWR